MISKQKLSRLKIFSRTLRWSERCRNVGSDSESFSEWKRFKQTVKKVSSTNRFGVRRLTSGWKNESIKRKIFELRTSTCIASEFRRIIKFISKFTLKTTIKQFAKKSASAISFVKELKLAN